MLVLIAAYFYSGNLLRVYTSVADKRLHIINTKCGRLQQDKIGLRIPTGVVSNNISFYILRVNFQTALRRFPSIITVLMSYFFFLFFSFSHKPRVVYEL